MTDSAGLRAMHARRRQIKRDLDEWAGRRIEDSLSEAGRFPPPLKSIPPDAPEFMREYSELLEDIRLLEEAKCTTT